MNARKVLVLIFVLTKQFHKTLSNKLPYFQLTALRMDLPREMKVLAIRAMKCKNSLVSKESPEGTQ